MPIDSKIGRAIRRAESEATKRGHKLGSWGFMHGQAANCCDRDGCRCGVLVTPGDRENELRGAAIVLGCLEDGNAWLERPEPAPSAPDAMPQPQPVATDAPAFIVPVPQGYVRAVTPNTAADAQSITPTDAPSAPLAPAFPDAPMPTLEEQRALAASGWSALNLKPRRAAASRC